MSNFYRYMSVKTHIPRYFALRSSDGFKLFTSSILRLPNSQDVNILSRLEYRTIYYTSSVITPKTIFSSITRKWYGGDTVSVNWTQEGSEVAVMAEREGHAVTQYIPVIIFIKCVHGILPSGGEIYIPRSSDIHYKHTADKYDDPEVHYTDPFLSATSSSVVVPVSLPGLLPKHVKAILIECSIKQKDTCPISGEYIMTETATVTSCGHVFERSSISRWLSNSESNSLCPICKQRCAI